MDRAYLDVRCFHETFGLPVSNEPVLLTKERAGVRGAWMLEEVKEFIESDNIDNQARELIDVIYLALGSLVEMGIPPQSVFDVIHSANMSKVGADGKPVYAPDGKITKPQGFKFPLDKLHLACIKG